MAGVTAEAAMNWRGVLSARDVPCALRMPARVARVSAAAFIALLACWVAALVGSQKAAATLVAIGLGFAGAIHAFAVVVLRLRALKAAASHSCLRCGYALAHASRPAVCPECGRAAEAVPSSPTLRDALREPRSRVEGIDTRIARIVAVIALLAGLLGALAVLVFPHAGLLGVEAGDCALGLLMFAYNAPLVCRTLHAVFPARRCEPD